MRLSPLPLITVLVALAGVAPGVALAAAPGNAEVVSRASGAQGAAPFTLGAPRTPGLQQYVSPGVVSDDGRYAAFTINRDAKPLATPDEQGATFPLYLRDLLRNTTTEITSTGLGEATGIDRTGRLISYVWSPPGTFGQLAPKQLGIYDVVTRTRTIVGRASGVSGALATGAVGRISGDGMSVVFFAQNVPGSGSGLYRRALATGITTRIGDLPDDAGDAFPTITSVSDDGRTVAAMQPNAVYSPAHTYAVGGIPVISADGKTAAFLRLSAADPAKRELVSLDPSTGTETLLPLPVVGSRGQYGPVGGGNLAEVAWVSPDGGQIAVFPSSLLTNDTVRVYGQVLDRGASQWRPAGPYGESFQRYFFSSPSTRETTALSRNGRFALFPPLNFTLGGDKDPRALVVADNWAQHGIPGGADLPPAGPYLENLGPLCPGTAAGVPTVVRVTAKLAPRALPKAASVRAVVSSGGRVLFDGTGRNTTDYAEWGDAVLPSGATTYRIAITVTFAGGETAKDAYDFSLPSDWVCGA